MHNGFTKYSYNGLSTAITTPDNKTTTTTLDSTGWVASVTDPAGASVIYSYNSLGKPDTITSNGLSTFIGYDYRGNRTSMKDPNTTQQLSYTYDFFNRLESETNARGQTTYYKYDLMGRIKQMSRGADITDYHYKTSGNGLGQLDTVKFNNVPVKQFAYGSYGQLLHEKEFFEGAEYMNQL